ncbi:MAG: TetR/AcrR family transcriptional regulator [Pseudomonadota bacterium]
MSSIKPTAKDSLLEAGFATLGTNPGASLADVARAAGVGRATLHRYFSSREQLFNELTRTAISEMDAAVEAACRDSATAFDALRDCLNALIPLGDRYGFLMQDSVRLDPDIQHDFARQQEEIHQWIEAAVLEGRLSQNLPAHWIVRSYEYAIYAAWEAIRAQDLTPAQASALAWQTLVSGVGSSV